LRCVAGLSASGRGGARVNCSLGRLDRDEAHGRSLHGLSEGLSIAEVVLVSLQKWLDVLGGDQPNVVPEWLDLAGYVMRARTRPGLEAEKAGRQIDKPAEKLVARYLDAHHDCATLVETDEVEGVLADVEADGGDGIEFADGCAS